MADPTPAPDWKAKYGPILFRLFLYAITALVGAVATYLGVPPKVVEVTKEVLIAQADPVADLDVNRNGWTPDAAAADRDARNAQFPNFGDTPAGQVGDAIPAEVFLWQAEQKLTGKPTPLKDQNPTGSCVGFGSTTACERSLAADIVFRRGQAAEFAHFAEEVTYAGSKVEGARALNATVSRSDGSAGVFVKAYFAAGYGLVPKAKYGSVDLTEYSAARARSWNTSGPPKDVLEASKKFPVKSAAKVTSWDQVKKALASGYGVTGCASWVGYAQQRDANGIAHTNGEQWDHCMCIDGYCSINGREYGHVENSWSNIPDKRGVRQGPYHRGPVGPGNPTTAGFWAAAEEIDRAVRQGDSFALSGVTGFPARKLPPLDWAAAPAVRQADPFALLRPRETLRWDRHEPALGW